MKIAVAGATGRLGRHVVEVLEARGHDVVPMSRSSGVDVVTGDGLDAALDRRAHRHRRRHRPLAGGAGGHRVLHDGGRNLHEAGARAGVSAWPSCRSSESTGSPPATRRPSSPTSGPCWPARSRSQVLRAAQFHEFIAPARGLGPAGRRELRPEDAHPAGRRQAVAEVLVDIATDSRLDARTPRADRSPRSPVHGRRTSSTWPTLLAARSDDALKIEGVSNPADPDSELYESGALLPGPDAILAGPTFEEWLDATT